jgi:uncharacterized protein (DUF3084 family)
LTKVLVVFVAVLGLMLSSLTMAFAVNVSRIKDELVNERDRRIAVEASFEDQIRSAGEERDRIADEKAALAEDNADLRSRINGFEAQIAQLNNDKRIAEDGLSSLGAKISGLSESVKTLSAQNEAYRIEVIDLRQAELDSKTTQIQLVDRINELEAQQEVLQQDRRALLERVTELQDTIARADEGDTGVGDAIGPAIAGRVVETRKEDSTGMVFARINVGANDNVRDGMRFSVVRNDREFAGFLTITKTDLQWAVGRFDDFGQGTVVNEGDMVLSRIE